MGNKSQRRPKKSSKQRYKRRLRANLIQANKRYSSEKLEDSAAPDSSTSRAETVITFEIQNLEDSTAPDSSRNTAPSTSRASTATTFKTEKSPKKQTDENDSTNSMETDPPSRCFISKADEMTGYEDTLVDNVVKMEEVNLEPETVLIICDGSDNAPSKFFTELYEEDLEIAEEMEIELESDDEVLTESEIPPKVPSPPSPSPPPYSPLSSPECGVRDRSRSLERQTDQMLFFGDVIGVFDEELNRLDVDPDNEEDEDYMSPDAHPLYAVHPTGVVVDAAQDERDMEARRVRSRVRGAASRRGRGRPPRERRGGRRCRGTARTWEVGHPLEEIWMTDDDVPQEMQEMVEELIRKRRMRANNRLRKPVEEDEDEFEDAIDHSIIEEVSPYFEWSPMESFQIEEETFLPQRTGSVACYSTPYDAFRSYWDESIIQIIVEATNRYATNIQSSSFQSDWYPTNSDEIFCLFAFWMMLGIVRMPTIVSCFSNNPLLKTEVFRLLFSKGRYKNLVRALQFYNSDSESSDRLNQLRPIIDHLNTKFQSNYVPSKNIAIDESLTLWKGRLDIRQYIKTKAARFGIKTFELCESTTGYLWSFLVYTGRHNTFELSQDSNVLKSTAVVKNLIAPLLNKGYRLFMDNWYNSPLLARFLKRNGTDCVGTLRPTRQDVPPLINHAPLKQGQLIARHAGDVCVLAWQDQKRVTMLSTCHGSATGLATVPSRPPPRPLPFKPQVVLDYNKYMGGVDLKDQMLEPYLLERKRCMKWHMKLFKRFLNCSILNARTLLQSSRQLPVDHLQFRLELVDSIIELHLSKCPKSRRETMVKYPPSTRILNHKHWAIKIPPSTSELAKNRQGRLKCNVCMKRGINHKTPFKCEACRVPLCAENCFRIYHSSEYDTLNNINNPARNCPTAGAWASSHKEKA